MEHKGTVRIETDRLVLRRFTPDDADAIFNNWASDDEVTKFLTWPTHPNTDVTKFVLNDWVSDYAKEDNYQWGITIKENGDEVIGSIAAVDVNDNIGKIHIGYCIGRKWWHCGITSEAFSAVIPFLFQEVKANRIESQHDPNNPYSGEVMAKCGLKHEGTLRKADWSNKGIVDACMYSLLREEWFCDHTLS